MIRFDDQATLADLIGAEASRLVVEFRRDLHRHPEIGMETFRTAEKVEQALRTLGVEEIRRFAGTGVAALIPGERPGPTIGFRADMDALPIAEETGLEYASEVPKCAHLCGHDGHAAGLLAFAAWVMRHRRFAGSVLLIFQPGEEGYAGADKMIREGLFEVYPCREVFAIHAAGKSPLGEIRVKPGAMMASVDVPTFVVEGRGGHGGRPHQTVDPVPVAAELILALQTIVSRNVDAADSAVVSLCALEAGDMKAPTVIPARVSIRGTVRTHDPKVQDLIERRMRETAEGIGLATETTISLDYARVYPPQMNDPELFAALEPVLAERYGRERMTTDFRPGMGGEDFAFMSAAVPGIYIQLGIDDEDHSAPLHSPKFSFNERVLPMWTDLFTTILRARLPLED